MRILHSEDLDRRHTLTHDLEPKFEELRAFRTRRALERSQTYREHHAEIERVLHGFDWELGRASLEPSHDHLRAVAWNVERGKRFDPLVGVLQTHPELSAADLLFLTELDIGMGRSGNRHIPRELARRLGVDYVFANFHLVLAPGDSGEQDHGVPNRLGLHGSALMSRYPIRRFAAVSLPELKDKYEVLEKRLGTKRALLCEVELPDGPLTVVVVHLDPFSSPRHRARQARIVVDAIRRFGGERVLLGGDLNTNTYNLGSGIGLATNVLHKLLRFGFAGTIRQYMTPEHVFERRLFEVFRRAGLAVDPFVDPERGSTYYDTNDPDLVEKSLSYLPKPVYDWLQRKLRAYDGCVPLRIDWFAGRGVRPIGARTIERPSHADRRVSDHNPVLVDLALARPSRAAE